MVEDFVTYLSGWEPYYQHSIWLIKGSRWQPGILKLLNGLGPQGKPIVAALKDIVTRYGEFSPKRIPRDGMDLQKRITEAIKEWEGKYGNAKSTVESQLHTRPHLNTCPSNVAAQQ